MMKEGNCVSVVCLRVLCIHSFVPACMNACIRECMHAYNHDYEEVHSNMTLSKESFHLAEVAYS